MQELYSLTAYPSPQSPPNLTTHPCSNDETTQMQKELHYAVMAV